MDFDIRRGALYGVGELEEKVIIPKEVTNIYFGAFPKNDIITEIILEDGFKSLSSTDVFSLCSKLETITFPDNSTVWSITDCPSLTTVIFIGENHKGPNFVRKCPKLNKVVASKETVMTIWNKFPKKVKFYDHNGERIITPAEQEKEQAKQKQQGEKERLAKSSGTNPLVKEFTKAAAWADKNKLDFSELTSDQDTIDKLRFVLYAYANQMKKEPVYHAKTYKTDIEQMMICKEADEVAATIDPNLLKDALLLKKPIIKVLDYDYRDRVIPVYGDVKKLVEEYEPNYICGIEELAFLIPLCRYADSETVRMLTINAECMMKHLSTHGRKVAIAIRSGLLLNDTKEAMAYLDKYGKLERYAEMRGKTEQEVLDSITSDIGLKSDGSMTFDL